MQLLNITVQLLNIAVQLENNCMATNGKIYTGSAITQKIKHFTNLYYATITIIIQMYYVANHVCNSFVPIIVHIIILTGG